MTIAEKIAEELLRKALQGSVQHFHEIANRVEGLPTQTIDYGPLQAVYEAEPGEPRVRELIKRVGAVMVERAMAYKMELPEFVQEALADGDAETGADGGGDGKQRGPVGGADDKAEEDK